MRIKREGGIYDTLRITENGNEFQLYILDLKERTGIELHWMDEDDNEHEITPGENQRLELLEALRDWSNDQIWKLQHEEVAD